MNFSNMKTSIIDHKTIAKEMAEKAVSFAWENSTMLQEYTGKDDPKQILDQFSKSLGIGEFNIVPEALKKLNALISADVMRSETDAVDVLFTGDAAAIAIICQLQIHEVIEKISKTSTGRFIVKQQTPDEKDPLYAYVEAINAAFTCNNTITAMINDSTMPNFSYRESINTQFKYIKLNMLNKFIFHNETKNTNVLIWIGIEPALELMRQHNIYFSSEDFDSPESFLKSFLELYDTLLDKKILKDKKISDFSQTLIKKALEALRNE